MKTLAGLILMVTMAFVSASTEFDTCTIARDLWTHGERHLEQGSPESQRNLDSAIQLCPTYAMAWRERGVAYLKRGDFGNWAPNINKAIELEPLGFLGIRGWCRFDFLRDYEGAIADLTRLDTLVGFHTMYASDYNIYLIIGEANAALGNYDEALLYYDKDINNTIKERGASWVGLYDYLYRGILKYKMGNLTGALDDFDNEIKMYESLADPYYFKGLVYAKLGKNEDAVKYLLKALELINGKGFKHKDPYCEVQEEIYVSDVEETLSKLN